MQHRILAFEGLMAGWQALFVLGLILYPPKHTAGIFVYVIVGLCLSLFGLLAWMTSRLAINWARWTLLVAFIFLTCLLVNSLMEWEYVDIFDAGIDLGIEVAYAAAMWIVFVGKDREIFRCSEQMASLPREYGASKNKMTAIIFVISLVFIASLIFYRFISRAVPGVEIFLYILSTAMYCAFMYAMLAFTFTKTTLFPGRIVNTDGFGRKRTMRVDDIAGYRRIDGKQSSWIEFRPKNIDQKPIRQIMSFKTDDAWDSWIANLANLDKADGVPKKKPSMALKILAGISLIMASFMSIIILSIIIMDGWSIHEGSQFIICLMIAIKSILHLRRPQAT